jgi:hypothetical protein
MLWPGAFPYLRFESPCFVDEAARFVPSAPDEASRIVYENSFFAETGMHALWPHSLTPSPAVAILIAS